MANPDAYAEADALMRSDFEHYCAKCVKIKAKDGAIQPFTWNKSQHYVHRRLEQQLEATGSVRAMILKARQLGISTYVGARFYHKTTLWAGRRTHILTHLDDATQQLFGMAKLIHKNMPRDYRPKDTSNNANQITFGLMDGGYSVGTAFSTSGKGRSQTYQLFHGSEVAFWRNAKDHFASSMQAVPKAKGTEVILESTANGVGGTFNEQWNLAESGKSDFIAIFDADFVPPENILAMVDELRKQTQSA